jgi:hypothetical protein
MGPRAGLDLCDLAYRYKWLNLNGSGSLVDLSIDEMIKRILKYGVLYYGAPG